MENFCRKVLVCDREPVWRSVAGRYCFVIGACMENCCRKLLFFDREPVWKTVKARYCFVRGSQCVELLQEGIVL